MVSLGHVSKQIVSSQINVVNDFAQIGMEIRVGEVLQVLQVLGWDVSLPLQFTLALLADGSEVLVLVHVGGEGPGQA